MAVAAPDTASEILAIWRDLPAGDGASLIGKMSAGPCRVILETEIGGERFLEYDPLPRIC